MSEDWHFDKEKQHRMKRDRLVRVAADCFNRNGFSGTSLKTVAKQLNVTDAALYYYVKNKEELVNLCYIRAVELAKDALDRAIGDGGTNLEKLKFYIEYQIHVLTDQDIGPVAILSEISILNGPHREMINTATREHSRRLAQLVDDGIRDGDIEPCDSRMAVAAIMGAVNWMPKWYRSGTGVSPDQVALSFVGIFASGLERRR